MKRNIFIVLIFVLFSSRASAAGTAKLPYSAGERFVVSSGYNTPPTHIGKDSYAIDLTQSTCDAYGKYAVAAMQGTVLFVAESGYNGGYGTEVLALDSQNVIERYAHLIPGSVPLQKGDTIPQGTIVGEIGDTGLVEGTACAPHSGTHLHFAMYTENADGTFAAHDPEPISGYTNIKKDNWYVSDNILAATKGNLAILTAIWDSLLGNGTSVSIPSNTATTTSSSPLGASSLVSELPPMLSATSAPPSSSLSAVPLLVPNLSQTFSSRVTASSSSVSTTISPSIPGGSSSGGGGGGVSVSSLSSAAISSSDDPSDDVVKVCED